jgi:hypothetical protein
MKLEPMVRTVVLLATASGKEAELLEAARERLAAVSGPTTEVRSSGPGPKALGTVRRVWSLRPGPKATR